MSINSNPTKEPKLNVRELIEQKRQSRNFKELFEKSIPLFLFLIASVSVLTTVGIIYTLLSETIEFFKRVPIVDFFTGTVLKPLSQTPEFGVLPLIMGTVTSSLIAMARCCSDWFDDSHLFERICSRWRTKSS